MHEILKKLPKTGDRFTAMRDLQNNGDDVLLQTGNRQLSGKKFVVPGVVLSQSKFVVPRYLSVWNKCSLYALGNSKEFNFHVNRIFKDCLLKKGVSSPLETRIL